jgi:hypothetical protein
MEQPNRGRGTLFVARQSEITRLETLSRQHLKPADAQVRTVRHPTQNSKLESALAGEFLDELTNVSHRAGAIEIWLMEAVMSGAGYWASSQSRQR